MLEQQKVIVTPLQNIFLHISTLTVYGLLLNTFVFFTDAQIYDHFTSMVHCSGNFCQFKHRGHQITQHESCDRWCVSRQIRGRNETFNKNLSLLYTPFALLDGKVETNNFSMSLALFFAELQNNGVEQHCGLVELFYLVWVCFLRLSVFLLDKILLICFHVKWMLNNVLFIYGKW